MITIAEYVAWKQPETYEKLMRWKNTPARVRKPDELRFGDLKRLMETPPLPGRAGLLPGEKVV